MRKSINEIQSSNDILKSFYFYLELSSGKQQQRSLIKRSLYSPSDEKNDLIVLKYMRKNTLIPTMFLLSIEYDQKLNFIFYMCSGLWKSGILGFDEFRENYFCNDSFYRNQKILRTKKSNKFQLKKLKSKLMPVKLEYPMQKYFVLQKLNMRLSTKHFIKSPDSFIDIKPHLNSLKFLYSFFYVFTHNLCDS